VPFFNEYIVISLNYYIAFIYVVPIQYMWFFIYLERILLKD